MKKLKPTNAHITFIYKCPKCEGEIWVTQEEAAVDGWKVMCCGSYELDSIKKINVKYRTASTLQSEFTPRVELTLRGMGFTIQESRQLITKATDKNNGITSAEEMVRSALAEVE